MRERARVLVIDDDVATLDMLSEVLREIGLEVVGLGAAEAAIGLLQDEPSSFDLVITDEHMPGLRGTELARWVALRAGPPVLLLSGCSARELQGEGLAPLEIVSKAGPLSVLLERVGTLLGLQVLP
jgi:DNA-binding response OmpR family regulator